MLPKFCNRGSVLGVVYRRTEAVRARLDEQRAGLLRAASAQLAEVGYAGCSVTAVAARAGVATGTVYNHFAGKRELVDEVFRQLAGREVAAVRLAVAAEPTAPEQLVAFVTTFAARALRAPRLAYALLVEPVDVSIDELRLEFRRAFRDVAAGAIAAGVAAGHWPPQPPELVAAALVGAIGEALVGPLSGRPDDRLVPDLVSFALRSLGVRDVVHA